MMCGEMVGMTQSRVGNLQRHKHTHTRARARGSEREREGAREREREREGARGSERIPIAVRTR